MKKNKLDQEEQEILNAYELGEFKSLMTDERKRSIEQAAITTFKKDKRINIRLSGRDLSALQRRALEENIPYQTLVASTSTSSKCRIKVPQFNSCIFGGKSPLHITFD